MACVCTWAQELEVAAHSSTKFVSGPFKKVGRGALVSLFSGMGLQPVGPLLFRHMHQHADPMMSTHRLAGAIPEPLWLKPIGPRSRGHIPFDIVLSFFVPIAAMLNVRKKITIAQSSLLGF